MRPDNAAPQLILDSWKRCCAATVSRSSNCKACVTTQSGRKEAPREKGITGDTPDPGKGLHPLHSH